MRDIEEYIEHIKFLQKKGVLTDVFELHDLEELQGVSGLKAIRITITKDDADEKIIENSIPQKAANM